MVAYAVVDLETVVDLVLNSHLASLQHDACDTAEPVRAPHRSALSARRISSMPPHAPVSASRAPQRNPPAATPTPAGSTGESGAKRLLLQQQGAAPAKPNFEPQQLQVHRSHCIGQVALFMTGCSSTAKQQWHASSVVVCPRMHSRSYRELLFTTYLALMQDTCS